MLISRGRLAAWLPAGQRPSGRRQHGDRRPSDRRPGDRRGPRPAVAVLGACALAATLGISGCATAARADQTPAIQVGNGYVPVPITPGLTSAYLAIRNNAARPDALVSVTTSAGGRVTFRAPAADGAMRTVPVIGIPAHNILRLVPDGPHLLITGAGALQNGKVITITLRFRHGGVVSSTALVTNPQDTQGGNYSMN
jgi:copper(I)-binding protein